MLKNVSLMSKEIVVSNTPVSLDIGQVVNGMRRYITFIKLNNEFAGANAIFLCSGNTATHAASSVMKDKQFLGAQYDSFAYPDNPNIENPLFSIAGGKYLSAFCSAGKMGLFIQYYDE